MSRPGDLYGPPIREASVRGGAGRFSWEDVKKDEKFRDTYIGHSVMAPVGRWQQGKDLQWYARANPTNASDEKTRQRAERAAELKRVKEAEEEALAEALGFKVQRKTGETVSQEELARALKDEGTEGEGVEGLGFGRVMPRVGAMLPDGTVVQNEPAITAEENGSVEVNVNIKVEQEKDDVGDRERRKHKHRHRQQEEEDDDRSRRKHRRHRRRDDDRERPRRSESPYERRDRKEGREEQHSHRKHDRDRDHGAERRRDGDRDYERDRDGSRRERDRDHESRYHRSEQYSGDHTPRREYRERRDRSR